MRLPGTSPGRNLSNPGHPYDSPARPSRQSNNTIHRNDDDEEQDGPLARPRVSPSIRALSSRRLQPEQQQAANEQRPAAASLSLEELAQRPRSNQRNRTPNRYESPIHAHAFTREGLATEERQEGRRITVRPMVGMARGTALRPRQAQEQVPEEAPREKSYKQGPSHRKIRRWNNDNFVGIAAELAKSASRPNAAAEAILIAQANAAQYKSIYNPARDDDTERPVSKFLRDDSHKELRHQFFHGPILLGGPSSTTPHSKTRRKQNEQSAWSRIQPRLAHVVLRACQNSSVLDLLTQAEDRMLNIFSLQDKDQDQDDKSFTVGKQEEQECWEAVDSLLESPTVTHKKNKIVMKFRFSTDAARHGGFHRLLLHSLCQFHGWNSQSSSSNGARLLKVTARPVPMNVVPNKMMHQVQQYLQKEQEQPIVSCGMISAGLLGNQKQQEQQKQQQREMMMSGEFQSVVSREWIPVGRSESSPSLCSLQSEVTTEFVVI